MEVDIPCPICTAHQGRPVYIDAKLKHLHNKRAHPEQFGRKEVVTNDVQFYSQHAGSLLFPQANKVVKFLENGSIEYVGGNVYTCKHIEGYNVRDYRITVIEGEPQCDCQFAKKGRDTGEQRLCSHVATLFEYWKRSPMEARV